MRSRTGNYVVAFLSSSSRRTGAMVLSTCLALSFAFGAALGTSVISAAPASAHAVLVKVTPAANGKLTSAPTKVVLEFNEPISNKFATVIVTSAAGVNVAKGKPTVLGGKVTQPLSPSLTSGGYRVAYRVTSDDGHPVGGQSTFTLALAPVGTPHGPSAAPSATPPVAASVTPPVAVAASPSGNNRNANEESWLSRYLIPVTGAFALLVLGLGVLVWERQRH
jgi:methionine-rich copper-binding protein CopC